nr:MAG TPA: hypothetical protein [Caudoviricetes sp.]
MLSEVDVTNWENSVKSVVDNFINHTQPEKRII